MEVKVHTFCTLRNIAHAIYRDVLAVKLKKKNILYIFAQYIDCGYTFEPPRRGGSNEYPRYMFWSKNKKQMHVHTPSHPVSVYKIGVKGGILFMEMFS